MYGIGSSNALYPASLSFRMFIIISLFRIKPQPGVVYKSAVFKKHLTVLLSSLKLEKELCHMVLFLCLFGISLGQYCRKSLAKSKGFRKNIKRKGWF